MEIKLRIILKALILLLAFKQNPFICALKQSFRSILTPSNIKQLFSKMNEELGKFNTWFNANKLSLNAKKNKFTLFHKASQSENIPLKLPTLIINNTVLKQTDSLKFLGVLIDETLSWKTHIKILESKLAFTIGLLYRTRTFLNLKSRLLLYYSFVHSHLTYANIAWGSTHPSKLQKLASQQKHICKILKFKKRRDSAAPIMTELGILNIHNLNIFQTLIFMYKFSQKKLPTGFDDYFSKKHPSRYCLRTNTLNMHKLPRNTCKYVEHSITYRGPKLWNDTFDEIKNQKNLALFKGLLKNYLLNN